MDPRAVDREATMSPTNGRLVERSLGKREREEVKEEGTEARKRRRGKEAKIITARNRSSSPCMALINLPAGNQQKIYAASKPTRINTMARPVGANVPDGVCSCFKVGTAGRRLIVMVVLPTARRCLLLQVDGMR